MSKGGNKRFKIVEQDGDYGTAKSEDECDFGRDESEFQESDEDLPVIVNESEFLREFHSHKKEEEKRRSESPPRRTVDEIDDEDDIIYRDKQGKRITRSQWLLLNQNDDKKDPKKRPKQELVWGKGMVQMKDEEELKRDEQRIMKGSFQRFDIDDEYDDELRGKMRWNDPINKKSSEDEVKVPKSRFNSIPNRFNIEPGYRWDGVVRGNNYEQRWFEVNCPKFQCVRFRPEIMS